MKSGKNRRASALAFVLGIVFIASILSVYLIEYSVAELKPRASSAYERSLRMDAYSALNAAVAVLEEYYEIDGGLYATSQGWEFPLADGRVELPRGGEMQVKITDESGKIPLSKLTSENLISIFEEMQFSTSIAQTLAECILDWSDSDDSARLNGAERDDYDDDEAFPPNRDIRNLSELKYIQNVRDYFFDENGRPNEYYKAFSEIVSTEYFEKVNLNSASPQVLNMLLVMEGKTYDPSLYAAIRGEIGSIEDGIVWIKNSTEALNRGASEVPSKLVACQPALLKIEVTIKRGTGEYYLCGYYGEDSQNSSSQSEGNKNNSNSQSGSSVARPPSNNSANVSNDGKRENSAAKSAKTSNASSSSSKTTASLAKSSKGASKKGGDRKIIKIVERGSR